MSYHIDQKSFRQVAGISLLLIHGVETEHFSNNVSCCCAMVLSMIGRSGKVTPVIFDFSIALVASKNQTLMFFWSC